ncbi:glycine receptor subunit alpha-2-like isoform X2 [Liolophura sinensis]|uniref:glycine receptor subunit alpha-2-like isoform X2 n=1 Tax=Liolophura sinensis TaxID=3198878 RepID=UPI0031583491
MSFLNSAPMLTSVGLLILLLLDTVCGLNHSSIEDILDRLFVQNKYNSHLRPSANMDKTTFVSIGFYVQSLGSISEVNMEYTLDVYFRQSWNDPRLQFNDTDKHINTGPNYVSKLWIPDLYFMNSKKETFHTVTAPNALLRIFPNGDVFYSQRLSLVVDCNMHLQYFPMDEQTCDLKTMTYGYVSKDLTLKWMTEDSLTINEKNQLPEFQVMKTDTADCTQTFITGNYSCLKAIFHISRRIEVYLVQTYLPSVLIVVLSWVNFWIDHRATPARVSLGLLCVLTMTTQSTGVQAKLPRVSYIKAMDVWLYVCLVFVFGALLEYALVNVQSRKQEDNSKKKYQVQNGNSVNKENGGVETVIVDMNLPKLSCSEQWLSAERVDSASRVLFPSAFAIFNLIYWLHYQLPQS